MTRNQFQTGNVCRELFRLSCSFFKVAKDMLNCCRYFFLYVSTVEVQLAVLGQLHFFFFAMIRGTFLG